MPYRRISSLQEASDGAHCHQRYSIDWKPDATLLTQPSLSQDKIFALPDALAQKDPTDIIAKLESLCFAHLRRYLERRYALGRVPELKPWLQKYVDWAQHQMDRYARGELLHATKDWEILANDDTSLSALEAEVEQMCPEGPLTSAIGRNLGDILDGKFDVLETLFRPEMTEPVYRHGTGIETGNQYMSMYFDVLAHKNSNLVILGIGNGTGGATVPVIETLCRHGDTERGAPRFERYDFTDISPSFLETLNIENDPLQQGFEAEQYDVILAANVLHATKSIDNTLRMVRKLVMYEVTGISTIRSTFSFGLLPVAEWDTHLKRTGFSGIDLELEDASSPKAEYNKLHSVFVSTAESPQQPHRLLSSTVIVINDKSTLQAIIAAELKESLFSSSHLDSILWLSQGGGPTPWNPNSELITGFSRVARQENPLLKFITLSFEKVKNAESVVNSTLAIIEASLSAESDNDAVIDNSFYEIQDGVVQIGRIVEATYINDAVVRKTTQTLPQPGAFGGDPNRALKLVIGSPGLLDTLHFIDDPVYDRPLKEGEVEYKVMAAGLNSLDIMIALGQVVGNELGIEASGIITRTGPNSKLKVGDRVCGDGLGTIATYARTKEQCVAKIPDNMSFALAAGFGVVFITVYVAIFESANIQPGETILIHAGAGGEGQSCIQLAKVRGAEIYVTAGSVAKRNLLINHYGIPKYHIFSSRDLIFAQGIMRMTKGRGVDVVINSLSGAALLSMKKFRYCVRFECVDLRYMARSGSDRFSRYLEALLDLVRQGKISDVVPLNQVPFSQTQEAFCSLQGRANLGKIILVPNEEDIVPIVPSRKTTHTLDPNASFVICGGFGGIGKSICKWIVSRGAKYLIILSRSGASNAASKELVEELESNGTVVKSPKCDVSDAEAHKKALDECAAEGMPPVKGCIQASMVLRDIIFSDMTLDEYYTALRPKLDVSWDLHNLLPKDLDFFVLLSSISGIVGNAGQANYASGNTFQDALARYRVLNGLKATSMDVGAVLLVGYLAEQTQKVEGEGSAKIDLTTHMRKMAVQGMREDELLAIIEALCDPGLPAPTSSNVKTQVVLGLQVPGVFTSSGFDEPIWFRDPLFTHLHRIHLQNRVDGGDNPSQGNRNINYGLLLAAAESVAAGVDIVYDALATKLVRALNIPPEEVQPGKTLTTLGVDSLVAVEIRTFILKQLDADVSVFDLMDLRSLRALSEPVVTRSGFMKTVEEQEE
ncbi:polyketide synthase [Trichoderma arundinaceum]|uniref:Polyketide synthase n=1 Tax=Trichoderma arundinaceum TaxID=490622 RepID=A0A395NTJ8_TRIAR|nr:polyketide synthase [Trichoderma arundinaceum]